MAINKSVDAAAKTVKPTREPTREPSPVVMIAAFTEAAKILLGEIKGLSGETFAFQLRLMELLPEADRLAAFKAVLETHQHEVGSDERVALALFNLTEKLGVAAAAIIPPALALRQAEREERAEERARLAEEEADRKAVEDLRKTGEAQRNGKAFVNGKYVADAK